MPTREISTVDERRARMTLAVGLLTGVLLASALRVAGADCLPDGISTLPPPAVSYLRSYRADTRSPTRLAIDRRDNLYITDPESATVVVRSANGRVTARLDHPGRPVSVAVDGAGRVYVGDELDGSVTVFDENWSALFRLGIGPGEFALPGDIAVDAVTGRSYVADSAAHSIKVYGPGGEFLHSFGGAGALEGQLRFPAALFLDPVSRVLLVSDQLNFRLQAFDLDGGFLYCIGGYSGNPGSFFQSARRLHVPQGLWVDADGLIYVTDASEGRVRILDADGIEIGHIGEFGAGPGQLRIPMDVAMDGHGRLFVAASNNSRLEVFGIGAFEDPETILPARVTLLPNPWDEQAGGDLLTAVVTVPGYRISDIDTATVIANDQGAIEVDFVDADGDLTPELHARFDAVALTAGHAADSPLSVSVSGALGDMRFEGTVLLEVLTAMPADADADGIDDERDRCPGTAPGSRVDAEGCSVAQRCPCQGPSAEQTWQSHGQYLGCVVSVSRAVLGSDSQPRAALIAAAAQATCGREHASGHGVTAGGKDPSGRTPLGATPAQHPGRTPRGTWTP